MLCLSFCVLPPCKQDGDVELAQRLVERSQGIQRSRDLARQHAQQASRMLQLSCFMSSEDAASCARFNEVMRCFKMNW